MNYFVPFCLLAISSQPIQAITKVQDSYQPLILYSPSSGEKLEVVKFLDSSNLFSSRDISDNLIELPTMGTPCICQDYVCKCCLGLGFATMKRNLCVIVTINLRDVSVLFVVAMDNNNLLKFDISARNIRDICVPIPITLGLTSFCLRLYNIHIVDNSLNVCTSFVLKTITSSTLLEYKLGCLQLGFNGVRILSGRKRPELRTAREQKMVETTNDKLEIYS